MNAKDTKPRPPAVRVSVSKGHVAGACRRDSHHCMIADAIKAANPNAKYIMVDLQSIRWSDLKKGYRYTYFTPAVAQSALIKFDQGKDVQPFAFSLTPSKGLTQYVGWQKKHGTMRRKKYAATGRKRRVPMPSKEREYGLRRLEL